MEEDEKEEQEEEEEKRGGYGRGFRGGDVIPNAPHLEHVDSPSPEYVPLRHAVQM